MNKGPLVLDEMLYFIRKAITENPRSLQKRIGPSQMGTPCDRKLAYRLAQAPVVNVRAVAWQAQVGTAVHTWLTDVFVKANDLWPDEPPRWLTDLKVTVGVVDGTPITGRLDLLDTGSKTVVDWKIPGPTSMKSKRAHGPGQEYRTQLHLYAAGAIAAGHEVTDVMLLALPAAGRLEDCWHWTEPYDPAIAQTAVQRNDALAVALRLLGPEVVLPQLGTADDFCNFCDHHKPGVAASGQSCPGDSSLSTRAPAITLAS